MSHEAASLRIRRMTAADLDRVIEIATSLPQAPHWPRNAYLIALSQQAPVRRVALVAEETKTGVVAGFAVASVMPPEAELETIAVAGELQRRGVARRLFTVLAEELRRQDVRETMLEVRASNSQAQAFYRSLGFAEAGRRPRYYADPVEDAVLMRVYLGRSDQVGTSGGSGL